MRRQRLRPVYSPDEMAWVYAQPLDALSNPDHRIRIAVTIQIAKALVGDGVATAADLSCGDAAIICAVPAKTRYFGDFAPGWPLTGPMESTLEQIPDVDLFICCETLEHLDDPDMVLRMIRSKATGLVLSTPVGCFHDTNPEHYWAWDRQAVEVMLAEAGFGVLTYAELDLTAAGPHHYTFGIWAAR